MTEAPIHIRLATEADQACIYSDWLKSYRDSVKDVRRKVYFEGHHALITRLLKKADVYVACNPEDKEQIFGWICFNDQAPKCLHYVYVKKHFRGFGISRKLFEFFDSSLDKPFHFTHESPKAREHFQDRAVYNPYLLMEA